MSAILENPLFVQTQVMASASANYDYEPITAFDPSLPNRWASRTKTDWLQICFRTVLLKLTKYTYSTERSTAVEMHGSLKSWDLLASINGSTWSKIDTIRNTPKTNGQLITGEFEINIDNYYNCFRFVGIDTWRTSGTKVWTVLNIGLYGFVKQLYKCNHTLSSLLIKCFSIIFLSQFVFLN